jgi:hypothetical protein
VTLAPLTSIVVVRGAFDIPSSFAAEVKILVFTIALKALKEVNLANLISLGRNLSVKKTSCHVKGH